MGAKHGPPQNSQCSRIDAFDMWALRKIPRIPYTRHVTNVEVRATIGCHSISHLVTDRRLRLFGHIAHHRAVAAVIRGLPPDWKRPSGRPSHTWLCAVEADLGQQNIGLRGRQLFVTTGARALWTQQRSSGGLCYKRKRRNNE